MTFSVAKSFLSLLAGVAVRDGLIADVDDPVNLYIDDGGFESEHNAPITWRHLLQQTSEWEGELFGKPDWLDRNRSVRQSDAAARRGTMRALQEPGTFFEYNDVRVNRLSLALLRIFREPLPDVLRREIGQPIGLSDTWEWHGYRTSVVDVDGRPMVSVPGGGHWGGIWLNTLDMARVGLLVLCRGTWANVQVLPERWVMDSTTPSPLNAAYGYLWWLNTERQIIAGASASSFFAMGGGGNLIWVDPEHDLVGVFRWTETPAISAFAATLEQARRQASALAN